MKKVLLLISIALVCSALAPPVMHNRPALDQALSIAIADFSKCRLFKRFAAFTVSMNDISALAPYKINDSVATIHIFPAFLKYHITPTDTIGSTRLPTKHAIVDGKLFYWHDPDYGLTEEMVEILYRFHIADSIDITDPAVTLDDYADNYIHHRVDEKTEGADYYFCKNDPRIYKRVITCIGIGWYKPPKIRCSR